MCWGKELEKEIRHKKSALRVARHTKKTCRPKLNPSFRKGWGGGNAEGGGGLGDANEEGGKP